MKKPLYFPFIEDEKKRKEIGSWYRRLLLPYVNLRKSSVLEIGCGVGRFADIFRDVVLSYSGIDIDEGLIDIANEIKRDNNLEFKLGSAEEISYNKKLDCIFYFYSFHFIKDFEKAFEEALRVLNKGGIILIVEPTKGSFKKEDSRLNKDSRNFNEEVYRRKMARIARAENFILDQKKLELLKKGFFEEGNYFILRKN